MACQEEVSGHPFQHTAILPSHLSCTLAYWVSFPSKDWSSEPAGTNSIGRCSWWCYKVRSGLPEPYICDWENDRWKKSGVSRCRPYIYTTASSALGNRGCLCKVRHSRGAGTVADHLGMTTVLWLGEHILVWCKYTVTHCAGYLPTAQCSAAPTVWTYRLKSICLGLPWCALFCHTDTAWLPSCLAEILCLTLIES